MSRILLVEDEPKLAALVGDYLRAGGYGVDHLADGLAVIPAIRQGQYDLVLLDLMLPGRDGLDICRELRGFSHLPLIMMTARVDEIDRLLGLELGADDYICKPFSPRELVARVKAVLRRSGEQPGNLGLELDARAFQARYRGVALELTPVEFRMLAALAVRPGQVLSRDQLMNHIYQDHRVVADRTVDSHVKNLRRKLTAVTPGHDPIRSVYGVGYSLEFE
ncbi:MULTISPECIES: response regulator [Pseudomonas]|jgi:two-component system response regulator BaeR|uniref:Response regulator n=1 Tax=Pseudomonas monteilii TaxID=76759 RepID=A0A399M850_9PSED|nr:MULTISPECIES: response regulator [Pseudomonas]MBI6922751.1 response regulator [Pseudomonas monteilii]MCE0941033.1 response regulator [Pseudomonas kurunegalensis]MDD2136899.1 response regulator [Pseudomonas kurunegalensis]MDR2316691.1 response regulator [Pseudomonas sp.]PRN01703.1 DNA-binding response regulator [Pseudomonas sp. LLC-1]